ncbi:adam a disintegrin and metalloprotease domain [Holotrichia oblita]|uniref:Adam a disintegrin and metalloprotease domain n=1 Tax=Holotrichia oblita TaxID=644536 RepID=A0ACB9T175_HOLOL|nr:adam a disintegrin and metalloprotease domain [Holotrichia oblita]
MALTLLNHSFDGCGAGLVGPQSRFRINFIIILLYFSKFSFNNGVVGKALKGPICTYQFSGGVNNNHSPVIGLVATTIAHEMGHNFGMEHDTNECACPEDRCIMAPSSSSVAPKHWSNCSVEYLALAFEHGMDYCLRNKPKSLFGTSVCGNGFVEPGEQCDCGLPEHCDNTCCNATTCLLNANASCATGECCDLNTCKPRRAGTMCRSADIECDLPEYCLRDIPNIARPMSTNWMPNLVMVERNVLCGMLHCKHLNERLEFGMESVAILSHSFLNLKGSIIPCRTAIVDLGLNQVDPGLAPDGAKCGNNSMCVNQTCLSVESLRAVGPRCPNNCNGNGVCNSLGHCHCKDGFGSPTCEYPGPGGSQDSGPASDPNARKEFVTAVFIIFLGIIPALALISLLLYYARQNLKLTWSQSSSTYVTCCFSCLSRISQRTFTACKGMGNTKKTKTQPTLPTVSENVEKQQNFERLQQESEETGRRKSSNMDIMFSKLVFTTNKQGINNSVSVKNPQATQGETPNTSSGSQKITVIEEPPKRRMSFKNIKGLKVNTNVKLGKKSVSNEGSTAEPLIDEASTVSVKNLAKQFDFQNKRCSRSKSTLIYLIVFCRSKQISKSRGPVSFQPETLKRPTEDNHSLLTDEPTSPLKNEFFGHFKGFTISPKKIATEPSRPAPPIPVVPIIVKSPNLNRSNTCASPKANAPNKVVNRTSSVLTTASTNSSPPALPPLNNGANPRPIISSPILENSTCTAKELLSPLKNAPKIPARPAPELPTVFAIKETQRPLSAVDSTSVMTQEEPKKPLNGSALNRIASFLKPAEKKPQISPSNSNSSTASKKLMDKNVLRTLEISNPILQNEIKTESKTVPLIPAENPAVVMRAQSMRGTANTIRPQIPKFGSMRQANGMKRPMSIPSGSRPKSPPPPRPAAPEIIKENKKNLVLPKIPSLPGYQKPFPDKKQNQYDDCLNGIPSNNKIGDSKSPSSDNIYAVIEESPVNSSETTSPETTTKTSTSGSSESFGLLGEIVTEIQNRNFDSIYSTSTLARKKKLDEQKKLEMEKKDVSETYVNTSSIYKSPESVYSNMSNVKSSASSTSSGYIAPSAVNLPIKPMVESVDKKINSGDSPEKLKEVKPTLSTFKAPPNQKTFSATPNRNSTTFTSNKDNNKSTNEAVENNKNLKSNQPPSTATQAANNAKILERQVTPTKLRTRKPSPSRSNANTNPKPSTKTTASNNNSNASNNKSNSPDLVTSCANSKKTNGPKPPDVLNGSMKRASSSGAPGKPNLPKTLPKNGGVNNNNNKSVSGKTVEAKTGNSDVGKAAQASVKFTKQNGENANNTKVIGSGVKLAARQHSNVASLQQKFENKPPISTKTVQSTVSATVKK